MYTSCRGLNQVLFLQVIGGRGHLISGFTWSAPRVLKPASPLELVLSAR